MLSIYPICDDDNPMPETGWDLPGYHDNDTWIVTYQRNEHAPIETHYTGTKSGAIWYYRQMIEAWG